MNGGLRAIALLACLLCVFSVVPACAASIFDRLVTPGPLSQAHAKLEADCLNCHKAFVKKAQDDLCLGCHKDIAADIAGVRGFHGRNPVVKASGCKSCHVEHGGREVDITRLNPKTFDHAMTDYPLTGGHTKVQCSACHAVKAKFRAAPRDCIGCHAKDDIHKGSAGAGCVDCHGTSAWKTVSFDHDRNTKFPLTGGHAKVKCDGCHTGDPKTHKTPGDCASCHGGTKDPHKGKLGTQCQACHNTVNWKQLTFDHDQTAFPLIGKHAKVVCADCHKTSDFKAAPVACASCHEDKHHEGRLGHDCGSCHNAVDWKLVRFDHARDAHFALEGAHAVITCEKCHTERKPASLKLPVACVACHKSEDVHHGAFGDDCARCHKPAAWKPAFIPR